MKKIVLLFSLLLISILNVYSQCFEDEPNKYVCVNLFGVDTVSLLNNPPFDVHQEYTYRWETYYTIGNMKLYASDFLNDTTLQNPLFVNAHVLGNGSSLRFTLTVMSSDDVICVDSLNVNISSFGVLLGDTRLMITQGDTATIFPMAGGGYAPYIYNWEPNYNILDITAEQTKVWPEIDTVYHVTFTDSVGCVSPITSWMIKVLITGTDELPKKEESLLIPNPVYNATVVELNNIEPSANYAMLIHKIDAVRIAEITLNTSNNRVALGKMIKEQGVYIYSVYKNDIKIDSGKFYKIE